MKVHNVQQGSPEWLALRANHFTASEAPAMMGASKYQTRTDLLTMKKTGIVPEITGQQQRIFDLGHATEEMARPLVEDIIGEELFPIVGTKGNLLASMDGATLMGETLFEHKLWNEKLVAQIKAGELEPHYYWQLEQQLYVSGAECVIFVCSDGTQAKFVHMEYHPVPGRLEKLLAGWAHFEEELGSFVPPVTQVEVVGAAPDQLPALRIEVTGMVTASNLDAFKAHAMTVFGGINTQLETDQDFANAETTVKWCADVEDRLKAAKEHALSQTESIDALFKAIDDIAAEARRKRLELDKLVKNRKDTIRTDIVMDAAKSLQDHIDQINATLNSRIRMPKIAADFAGVIKGKRTIASLREAADTELARAKIEASRVADLIRANLNSLNELAKSHYFLFHDSQELVLKANDDLVALIKVRINEHDAEQAKQREQQRLEDERKAQAAIEARQQQEAAAAAAKAVTPEPVAEPVALVVETAPVTAAATATVSTIAKTPVDDGQRIKLGDIGARLGFAISADFLRSLGFEAVERKMGAQLYQAADFQRICLALIAHIQSVSLDQSAA